MNNKYMKKLNSDIQFKNNGIFCNAPRKKIKNKKKNIAILAEQQTIHWTKESIFINSMLSIS